MMSEFWAANSATTSFEAFVHGEHNAANPAGTVVLGKAGAIARRRAVAEILLGGGIGGVRGVFTLQMNVRVNRDQFRGSHSGTPARVYHGGAQTLSSARETSL
jgi:chemotaxis response regulator CheB